MLYLVPKKRIMKPSSKKPFNEALSLMKQCPLCKQEYKENGIKIIEEREGARSAIVSGCAAQAGDD